MNMSALIGSWHDTRRLLAIMTLIACVLTISLVMLAYMLVQKDRTVVLVPPRLASEMEISRQGVTEDYLKVWGQFIAHTIGNVTPGTVRRTREFLEPMLAPGIYSQVVARLETEIDKISIDQVTLRFEPRRVAVSVETGRVWVEGQSVVNTIGEGEARTTKTFEFVIMNDGYTPLITDLQTYEGVARLEEES